MSNIETSKVDKPTLSDRLYESTWWLPALDETDAGNFVERLFDAIINKLRSEQVIPRRSRLAWELAFADLRRAAEIELAEMIEGHVFRDDLIAEIERELSDGDVADAAQS